MNLSKDSKPTLEEALQYGQDVISGDAASKFVQRLMNMSPEDIELARQQEITRLIEIAADLDPAIDPSSREFAVGLATVAVWALQRADDYQGQGVSPVFSAGLAATGDAMLASYVSIYNSGGDDVRRTGHRNDGAEKEISTDPDRDVSGTP